MNKNDAVEQNLAGYEVDRSHYDYDAITRLNYSQGVWEKMYPLSCQVEDITGCINDFCIYWIYFWPSPIQSPPIKVANYPAQAGSDYELTAVLQISTPDSQFRTSINEPSARNFIDYLKDLDQRSKGYRPDQRPMP